MSCYLNINLSKFNPEGKFKFPEKIWTNQITGITEITDRQRLYISHVVISISS